MKYSQLAVIALAACATTVDARRRRKHRVQDPAQQTPAQVQPPSQQNSTSAEKAGAIGTGLGSFVNAANGQNTTPPPTDPSLQNRQAIDDDDMLALRYLIENLDARSHHHNPAPPSTDNKVTRGFDDNSLLEARRGGGGHGGGHGGGLGGGLGEFHTFRRRQAIEHALRARSVDDDERLALRYLIENIQARELERRARRRKHRQQHNEPPKTTEGLNTTSTNTTVSDTKLPRNIEALGARRRSVNDDERLALRYLIEDVQTRELERRARRRKHRQQHNEPPKTTEGLNSTSTNTTVSDTKLPRNIEALGARRRSVNDDERLVLRYLIEKVQARELERRARRRKHRQQQNEPPKTTEGLNSTSTNTTVSDTHKRSFELDLRSFDDAFLNDLD